MSIASLINSKGLSRGDVTPIGSGIRLNRDPWAPNYELILYGGKGAQPVAVSDELKQFIASVEFEDNVDQFDKLTITFINQVDDFGGGEVNSMIDSKLFAEGTIVEVQMGFGNSLMTVGAVSILKVEPDFPEDGPPTLQIIGYDLLHRASRTNPKDGISYKGFRDSQIASIIGERNGFDIKANDPTTFDSIIRIEGTNNDRVQKKGLNDYQFLKKVADINGFDLFSKFDPKRKKFALFFQPPQTKKFKQVHIFAYNEGDLAYTSTLLGFKPTLDASDQGTDFEIFVLKDKETFGSSFKPIERLTVEENNKFKQNKDRRFTGGNIGPNGGKKVANDDGIEVAFKAFGRSFRFLKHKRFKDEPAARKAIQEFIKRQKENFITGDGRIVGNEAVQSRQVNRLEGVSEQFSGKYFFTQVIHKMSASEGYFTEFSCRKLIEDLVVQAPPTLNLTTNDKRFKKKSGL